MERTLTAGGTDITEEAKSYMKLKRLLKARGVDANVVDTCCGVHALLMLGIKQVGNDLAAFATEHLHSAESAEER